MTPLLPAFTGTPEKNQVYNLDLFDLCAAMPSQSVDMILCDLPYAVHEAKWDKIIPIVPMWAEFKRVIKPRGAIVLTCVMRFAWQLIAANSEWFKYDMVGIKDITTDFMNAKNKPLRGHENILVFSDGTTANLSPNKMNYYPQMTEGEVWKNIRYVKSNANGVFGGGGRSIFKDDHERTGGELRYPSTVLQQKTAHRNTLHPNQKDIELFKWLIRSYTQPNQLVFDPCVGSGTTAVAAREEGRSFIVGDSSLEYVEIARARLAAPYTPSFMPQLDLSA